MDRTAESRLVELNSVCTGETPEIDVMIQALDASDIRSTEQDLEGCDPICSLLDVLNSILGK